MRVGDDLFGFIVSGQRVLEISRFRVGVAKSLPDQVIVTVSLGKINELRDRLCHWLVPFQVFTQPVQNRLKIIGRGRLDRFSRFTFYGRFCDHFFKRRSVFDFSFCRLNLQRFRGRGIFDGNFRHQFGFVRRLRNFFGGRRTFSFRGGHFLQTIQGRTEIECGFFGLSRGFRGFLEGGGKIGGFVFGV